MAPNVEICLLGPYQVHLAGKPVNNFATVKVQALLAYLALEAQYAQPREKLAGLFWPEQPEPAARLNLRQTLFNLRQVIPPVYLLTTPHTIQFSPDSDYRLDVTRFTELVTGCRRHPHPDILTCQPCVARLQQAVELYRGDFLADFYVEDSPAFEEWASLKREWLRRELLQTLYHLAAHYEQQGDYDQAYQHAWRQVALDSLREEAHQQLMRILASSGRRSEALVQYETCRQLLADELGIEPDQETTALYERIRNVGVSRGAQGQGSKSVEAISPLPSCPPTPRHNLPTQTTAFIGRETELAELTELLARPELRLISIVGPGGMGKTRLALELAATQLDRFEHGVHFVRLGPLTSAQSIVPAIAEALNFSFYSGSSPAEQLRNYLREKRVLLLMDSYEHLLDGVGVVVDLLKAAPGLKILATSRATLNVREEQRFSVRGIAVPDEDSPPEKEVSSAVKLFLESARRIHPDFGLTVGNMASVARICRLVQGMPLGLILAATWVETLTPAEIASELARSLDFLEGDLRDLPERQQSLRAVFDHSWRLLTKQEQEVFQQMSVFRGGFTREAAQEIIGVSMRELRTLVNKSLLHHTDEGWYEIHELLRQYTAESLAEQTAEVCDRHSAYYCVFLHQREPDLKGSRQQDALVEIEADGENVRAAWQWAIEREQIEHLDQALDSLGLSYLWWSRLYEGEKLCRLAAEKLATVLPGEKAGGQTNLWPPAHTRVLAKILIWLSIFNRHLRQLERAQQSLQQAQALLDSPTLIDLDTRSERAHLLLELAELASNTNFNEAREMVEQSLALYHTLDDPWRLAQGLDLLGEVFWNLGQLDQARRVQEECLSLRQALGDPRSIAGSLQKVAGVARLQAQFEESEGLIRRSLSIFRDIGDRGRLARGLNDLGITMIHGGKFAASLPLFKESLEIYNDLGLPGEPGITTNLSGFALVHLGQYQEAQVYLQKGVIIYRKIGNKKGIGYVLKNFGRIALAEERYSEAQHLLQESLTVFQSLEEINGAGQSLGILGCVALRLNNRRQALHYIRENLQIAVESRMFLPQMTALTGVALLLADQGEKERAVELYMLALQYGHVANSRWYEDVAGRQIAVVASTLPPEVVNIAQERGRVRNLWATVGELLTELKSL